MTNGAWDIVREGAAAKLAASAGCATAGLRRAITGVDEPLSMLPEARVLQPAMTMLGQSGNVEEYTLEVPVEIVCNRPAGRRRSDPIAARIARAVQVEMWTGTTFSSLGVSVVDGRFVSATPGLSEYADELDANGDPVYDGYRVVLLFQVYETLTRTA